MTRFCDKYPCTEPAIPGECYCEKHQREADEKKRREELELYGRVISVHPPKNRHKKQEHHRRP